MSKEVSQQWHCFESSTKRNLTLRLGIKEPSTKSLQGAADKVVDNSAVRSLCRCRYKGLLRCPRLPINLLITINNFNIVPI